VGDATLSLQASWRERHAKYPTHLNMYAWQFPRMRVHLISIFLICSANQRLAIAITVCNNALEAKMQRENCNKPHQTPSWRNIDANFIL